MKRVLSCLISVLAVSCSYDPEQEQARVVPNSLIKLRAYDVEKDRGVDPIEVVSNVQQVEQSNKTASRVYRGIAPSPYVSAIFKNIELEITDSILDEENDRYKLRILDAKGVYVGDVPMISVERSEGSVILNLEPTLFTKNVSKAGNKFNIEIDAMGTGGGFIAELEYFKTENSISSENYDYKSSLVSSSPYKNIVFKRSQATLVQVVKVKNISDSILNLRLKENFEVVLNDLHTHHYIQGHGECFPDTLETRPGTRKITEGRILVLPLGVTKESGLKYNSKDIYDVSIFPGEEKLLGVYLNDGDILTAITSPQPKDQRHVVWMTVDAYMPPPYPDYGLQPCRSKGGKVWVGNVRNNFVIPSINTPRILVVFPQKNAGEVIDNSIFLSKEQWIVGD